MKESLTDISDTEYVKWRELSEEWKASKEPQPQFCQRKGISYNQFVYWRSKLLQAEGKSRAQLQPVKITQPDKLSSLTALIKVVLPNGIVLYISSTLSQTNITEIISGALQSC